MKPLKKATLVLVMASDGNPVITTLSVILLQLMFNFTEKQVEVLIFGKPFVNWFDVVAAAAFALYAGYAMTACAAWNSAKAEKSAGREP